MDDRTSSTLTVSGFTPYAQTPVWVLRAGDKLTSHARSLYGVIMSYADNTTRTAFPGRETLAEDMGVSVATVKRAIKELEDFGALIVERRRNKRTGNFYANHYTLVFADPRSPQEADFPRQEEPEPPWVTHDPRPRVTHDPVTTPTTTTTPTDPSLRSPSPSGQSHSSLRSPSTSGRRSNTEQILLEHVKQIVQASDPETEQAAADSFIAEFEAHHGEDIGYWDYGWTERLHQLVRDHGINYGAAKWLSIFTNTTRTIV